MQTIHHLELARLREKEQARHEYDVWHDVWHVTDPERRFLSHVDILLGLSVVCLVAAGIALWVVS